MVLNGVEQTVPTSSLEVLANYDITAIRWTERDEHVEALAA